MNSLFSARALAGFELFFLPWMRRRVRAVRIAGLPRTLPPGRPLLLVANHVSWWDGFALREVHRRLRPEAPLYTVMLERELRRVAFFRRLGAVGIDPDSPSSVAHVLRDLRAWRRARPDSVIAFFPQGRIWPSHRRPLGFRAGVELFARHLAPIAVLPVGLHMEPLNSPAPTLFASVGAPVEAGPGGRIHAEELQGRVEAELDRILAFVAAHGEHAAQRWPEAHARLPGAPLPGLAVPVAGGAGA